MMSALVASLFLLYCISTEHNLKNGIVKLFKDKTEIDVVTLVDNGHSRSKYAKCDPQSVEYETAPTYNKKTQTHSPFIAAHIAPASQIELTNGECIIYISLIKVVDKALSFMTCLGLWHNSIP
jgi:hypothetical protein